MPGEMVLGIDASGARCGFALVNNNHILGPKILWYTTVHTPKCENHYGSALAMYNLLVDTLLKEYTNHFISFDKPEARPNLIVAIEDPSAFAYATALHHTGRTTSPAAVFGFPWTLALAMMAIKDTWGMQYNISPVLSYQPTQWQSRLGLKDFTPLGYIKDALDKVSDEKHPEKDKKNMIRAVTAWMFDERSLMVYRELRSGRNDWVVEQDGVDAAAVAYVGLRESVFGPPATKRKAKRK